LTSEALAKEVYAKVEAISVSVKEVKADLPQRSHSRAAPPTFAKASAGMQGYTEETKLCGERVVPVKALRAGL
jgi:hypothetical protein